MSNTKIKMHSAAQYRINRKLLNEDTLRFLMQTFGCARKVYNLYIGLLYDELERRGFVNGPIPDDIKFPEVTEFKSQYPYLKEVDSLALANAKIHFSNAVKCYNEKSDHASYTMRALRHVSSGTEPLSFHGLKGMPKFHSKAHGDFSYTTNCQCPKGGQPTIRLKDSMLHIPKAKQDIPLILHRPFPDGATIKNVTISMETDGSLYASIGYEYEQAVPSALIDAAMRGDTSIIDELKFIGLDYSQQHFYVDNEGRKANYPHYYREAEQKLARLQKQLARMEYDQETHTGSKNYQRKLRQIQKLSRHVANQRRDFCQKRSTNLVEEYDVVVVEDIDLRAMGEALTLGKNLHDNGFGMFRDMLDYKLARKGSVLVKVPRDFASTKTCHCCGNKNPDVKLGVSEWDCPVCGAHHDRDENAAINICNKGKEIFLSYYAERLDGDAKVRKKAQALHDGRTRKRNKQDAA